MSRYCREFAFGAYSFRQIRITLASAATIVGLGRGGGRGVPDGVRAWGGLAGTTAPGREG
jgi:hypothetical protein